MSCRYLVTGGAGFIGSCFIRYILENHSDYKIVNFDKLTYAGNLKNLGDYQYHPNYSFIQEDICNIDKCNLNSEFDFIVHFAAESHVDRSIDDSYLFLKTNILGTHALLEYARKGNIPFLYISCYDEKTRALTTEGLKSFSQLQKGDQVLSLNPKTHKIEIKSIERVIVQPYKGPMVRFKSKRIDLLVTPNHNMFFLGNNKSKVLQGDAYDVSRRAIFWMPNGYWSGKNEQHCQIPNHGKVGTKSLFYLLGIFIGDGFTAYQEKEVETKTGLARKEYLEKSRDQNTGRFKKIKKESDYKAVCKSYRIFLDIPKNDKCRPRLLRTLRKLGIFDYHFHEGKAGSHIYFSSKAFLNLLLKCGKGAHNKHIPRWVLEYSPEYLQYLFDGLMDSDGSRNVLFTTVSKRLASDFCELCIKLGFKPQLREKYSMGKIGSRVIQGNSFYIYVAKTRKSISCHSNEMVDYEGKIWCLKIKDNKNLIVERNGRFDFCGNTDEVFGEIPYGSNDEDSPLRPGSPYAVSKASADLLVQSYSRTYKLPCIITRSTNNYGPYQYPEKLIPLFIIRLLQGKKVGLYGDGKQVRDWIWVEDHARALDLLLEAGIDNSVMYRVNRIYNIGSGEELTNLEVTRMILNYLKLDEDMIEFIEDRKGHDRRYSLDASKLRELGWDHKISFGVGLKKTIDWYKNNEEFWEGME